MPELLILIVVLAAVTVTLAMRTVGLLLVFGARVLDRFLRSA